MLISLIVPVYNTESVLARCVRSLMDQGLPEGEYEILLVNDGSTDGSGDLCQSLSREYSFIHPINQENQGISRARNTGILAAKGDYVCFVDSDDILATSGLSSLLPYCKEGTDLIRFWCDVVSIESAEGEDKGESKVVFEGSGREYLRTFGLETFCVNYLYNRSFLLENNLLFQPGIIAEDFEFIFRVMMADPQIVSINKSVYCYLISPNSVSTTRTPAHSRRWVEDLLGTMTKISHELEPFRDTDPVLYERCRESLYDKMISLFSRMLTADYSVKEFKAVLSLCREEGLLPLRSRPPGRFGLLGKAAADVLQACPFLYPVAVKFYEGVLMRQLYRKAFKSV